MRGADAAPDRAADRHGAAADAVPRPLQPAAGRTAARGDEHRAAAAGRHGAGDGRDLRAGGHQRRHGGALRAGGLPRESLQRALFSGLHRKRLCRATDRLAARQRRLPDRAGGGRRLRCAGRRLCVLLQGRRRQRRRDARRAGRVSAWQRTGGEGLTPPCAASAPPRRARTPPAWPWRRRGAP